MNLIYLHQFFAGPDAPGPAQPRALVRQLADRGHHVTVLACDLNAYNEQEEPEELYNAPDSDGSFRVLRLPVPRNLRGSLKNRLNTYARFAWSAYWYGKELPKPDVVMVSIQPLFSGIAAKKLSKHWRIPWLLELRDLWPDALVVKKAITPWQAAPLEKIARSLYFGANRVVSLTPGIKTELLKKGVPSERLDLLPNGFQPASYDLPLNSREEIRGQYGWKDQFVAVYTGTHVEVTAVDVIVRAGELLQDRPDIRLDLFGSGQAKAAAVALAQEMNLSNVHFHDPVPKSQIPAILAGADAGIMTLFKSPLIHIYFENKLIDYMGASLPIVAAMDGVQADLIRREGAGLVAQGMDHSGLARYIRELADQPSVGITMGEKGHHFISSTLDQGRILVRYAEALEALVSGTHLQAWDPLNLS